MAAIMEGGFQTPNSSTDQTFIGTLSAKGGVTIPVEVRRKLNVNPKDKVVFRMRGDTVNIEPGPMTLEEAMGSVTPLQPGKE